MLAALLLAVAAATATRVAAPPQAPADALVVGARDLPAGTVVTGADVTVVAWPRGARPDGAALTPGEAAGAVLTSGLRRGEPLTDARRLGPGLLAGQPQGTVVAPVAVSDAGALTALTPGRRVDVLARATDAVTGQPGQAERLARDVVVLAVPAPAGAATGLLGAAPAPAGTTLLLAVDEETARRLAGAAGGWTGVVLRS